MNPSDWDWATWVNVHVSQGSLHWTFGPVVLIAMAAILGTALVGRRRFGKLLPSRWRVTRIVVAVPGGSCEIARTGSTAHIALEAYIELATRKAALAFDTENDSILDVYNSWYQLFGEIRKICRRINPDDLTSDREMCDLIDALFLVLNDGLRPHLTKWQARFRTWHAIAVLKSPGIEPQILQRQFPSWTELLADLQRTVVALSQSAESLRRLAYGP